LEAANPHSGDQLLGKYRLIAALGHGGMADVYLAAASGPAGFTKLLVVKRLRDAEPPGATAMFLEEARLSARLNHPNIVQTYEVGDDDNQYFMVMEFLDGPNLQRLRNRATERGIVVPLPIELFILSQALTGLHHAHELTEFDGKPLNVVHRDLTPHNVVVTYQGECKIVDFGIAKTADSNAATQAGAYKGKVAYIPPEQLGGNSRVDRRADVFSAGVILWEAIAGRTLWSGLPTGIIFQRLAEGDVPPIISVKPETPPELVRICDRALAPDADQRYSTALEFQLALDEFRRGRFTAVSRREVSEFVTPLFQDERVRNRAMIESRLKLGTSLPQAGDRAVLVPVMGTHSRSRATPSSPGRARTAQSEAIPELEAPITREGQVPMGRKRYWVAGAVALVLIGGLGLAIRSTRSHPAEAPPAAAAAAVAVAVAPPPAPAAPAASPSPDEVDLQVAVNPRQAQLTLDDVELPTNPFEGKVPRDSRLHTLRASAPGFVSAVKGIQLGRDVIVQISLQRQSQGATPPGNRTRHAGSNRRAAAQDEDAPASADAPAPQTPDFYEITSKPQKQKAKRPVDTESPWKE
jgi:serine/threonine protein kinase